jgi:hypothetical protein
MNLQIIIRTIFFCDSNIIIIYHESGKKHDNLRLQVKYFYDIQLFWLNLMNFHPNK